MQDYGVREKDYGARERDYGAREKVRFDSGGAECAAWHYPGTNGGCVIMAGGFAVTKEPGTDLFAERFHEAGFSVLAFDYRHLGESGGQPRQVVRVREQLADWAAAIDFAARLPGVDPARLATWPSRPRGVTSSSSRRVSRGWPRRSPRRRTPTTWPPPATRRATRSRWPCCGSPGGPCSTLLAGWPAGRRGWCRWAGRRGRSRCSPRPTWPTALPRSIRADGIRTGSRRSRGVRCCG
jgi:fermentation-respiration switch protein FrsA (DUF1100 family)